MSPAPPTSATRRRLRFAFLINGHVREGGANFANNWWMLTDGQLEGMTKISNQSRLPT